MKNYLNSLVWHFSLIGLLLILIGVAVVFYPEIIVILIATILIALGLLNLSIAFKINHFKKNLDHVIRPFKD